MSVTRTPELQPPGDSSVQTIPDFYGAITGHRHTGHLIWLPDAFTYSGSTFSYKSRASYPTIYWHGGTGSTPTSTSTATLSTFKAAMTAGQLPPCIIVFLNGIDPDDSVEGWAIDAYDGSYPLETMLRYDLPSWMSANTRAANGPNMRARAGFSKGGFEVLRFRAKFGASDAAAFVVIDAPRLDADLGGAAGTYSSFNAPSTGVQQAKLFNSNSANLQFESPFASTAGTGLFNRLGANAGGLGSAPLLMLESDPGGASPATNAAAMNNAINTRLGAAGVTFTTANLDNAGFTPSHNLGQMMAAWTAEATNHLGWIRTATGWPL